MNLTKRTYHRGIIYVNLLSWNTHIIGILCTKNGIAAATAAAITTSSAWVCVCIIYLFARHKAVVASAIYYYFITKLSESLHLVIPPVRMQFNADLRCTLFFFLSFSVPLAPFNRLIDVVVIVVSSCCCFFSFFSSYGCCCCCLLLLVVVELTRSCANVSIHGICV